MRAYLVTTGTVFGLITIAHLFRIIAENHRLATEPWFLILTILAAVLSFWAFRLVPRVPKS